MIILPAIDIYEGKAVRLTKGDYQQMTVYHSMPMELVKQFAKSGAEYLHVVDLEGAKLGTTPNLNLIEQIVRLNLMKVEVGGGIRSQRTVDAYLRAGVDRVILGTAALTEPEFLKKMLRIYGEHIAVGVDIKDGMVATHGWIQISSQNCFDFCKKLEDMGVQTIICTDISKDGMLGGTNLALYRQLTQQFRLHIIASGGVSDMMDIRRLSALNLYGVIVGEALYEKKLDLSEALAEVKGAV